MVIQNAYFRKGICKIYLFSHCANDFIYKRLVTFWQYVIFELNIASILHCLFYLFSCLIHLFKSTSHMEYHALDIVVVTYYHKWLQDMCILSFEKMSPRELSLSLIFPNKSQQVFILFIKISGEKNNLDDTLDVT